MTWILAIHVHVWCKCVWCGLWVVILWARDWIARLSAVTVTFHLSVWMPQKLPLVTHWGAWATSQSHHCGYGNQTLRILWAWAAHASMYLCTYPALTWWHNLLERYMCILALYDITDSTTSVFSYLYLSKLLLWEVWIKLWKFCDSLGHGISHA